MWRFTWYSAVGVVENHSSMHGNAHSHGTVSSHELTYRHCEIIKKCKIQVFDGTFNQELILLFRQNVLQYIRAAVPVIDR